MANEVTTQENTQLSNSEKFTNKVLREFGGSVSGMVEVTNYQRSLIQGYFVQIDRALKGFEERRLRTNANNKDHKWDNNDPCTWQTIDLNALALDVVHYARMGLDMMQPNHLNAIPYKDNNRKTATGTHMYTLNLMPGYNGIQYIAEKYALDKPIAVTTEVVYSTDTFKMHKKDMNNEVESYEFEVNNPFDRGEIIGAFGYIEYDNPVKNKLVVLTKADIEKRKPKKAAAEFWGGMKTEWVNGKKTEVETDGWYREMCEKTIKREVYSAKNIPRDPKKIDDSYQYMKAQELRIAQMEVADIVDERTAFIPVDIPEPVAEIEEKNLPEMNVGKIQEKEPVAAEQDEQLEGQISITDMPGF